MLVPWAELNDVSLFDVKITSAGSGGLGLRATRNLQNVEDTFDKPVLVTVPHSLTLCSESVEEFAKVDGSFRELLDALGRGTSRQVRQHGVHDVHSLVHANASSVEEEDGHALPPDSNPPKQARRSCSERAKDAVVRLCQVLAAVCPGSYHVDWRGAITPSRHIPPGTINSIVFIVLHFIALSLRGLAVHLCATDSLRPRESNSLWRLIFRFLFLFLFFFSSLAEGQPRHSYVYGASARWLLSRYSSVVKWQPRE